MKRKSSADEPATNSKKQRVDEKSGGKEEKMVDEVRVRAETPTAFPRNVLGVIWSFGTTDEWMQSWSKVNRAWRYFSRGDPPVMHKRRKQCFAESRLPRDFMHRTETKVERDLREAKRDEWEKLSEWFTSPPCWRCGVASNVAVCVSKRLRAIRQGLNDKYPADIASYCTQHLAELRFIKKQEHLEELQTKWQHAVVQKHKSNVIDQANKQLQLVFEAIPDASPALRRKFIQLVANIVEGMGATFATDAWIDIKKAINEYYLGWDSLSLDA